MYTQLFQKAYKSSKDTWETKMNKIVKIVKPNFGSYKFQNGYGHLWDIQISE